MKKSIYNFCCFCLIVFIAACSSATSNEQQETAQDEESLDQEQTKVLVFSKTNGFRHKSIEPGIEAIKKLGQENNFSVESSEDSTIFTPDNLKAYAAIIFLNTTGDILNAEQQSAMEQYIQTGGGYVGLHSAADTEYEWPWYGKLVGAYFDGHPGNPNVREATLHVVDANHPSTEALPTDWERSDEWYNYKDINTEQNKDLIMLDETTYEGGTNGDYHPIAWYKDFDGGRAFYTGSGHTDESFSDPMFLQHLMGGIRYAMGSADM
ncbi:type 1 glutamine amidotransferase [Catalinimonas alkaloidigena]|uniref:ThuA domain-containing protein n=1 Tax=Catalinimonas alkaloidigena TaxID=1075417 RepID=UPI002405B0FF|nr:ThuA domain-containing protein [Catalinimonas alkaloidigena]MDF9796674.1 type 1 glutamine amidotransferase [Catalinimonas alkaloidigena]